MKQAGVEISIPTVVSNNSPSFTGTPYNSWGWLPILSLISAVGLFVVALAYEEGRIVAPGAIIMFWAGLLLLFLPIAARLLSSRPTRQERILLLILLSCVFYLVKYLQYPLYFAGYDEFSHWRTALDIATSGHLFHANPLLPISSYYPGLEIATSAVSSLTGLPLFVAGTIVIGVAQVVFVLSLYLFYEYITGSAHIAGIATILYVANPNFLFFDTDFAYESFALPLAVFVLFLVARRSHAPAAERKGFVLASWLGLGAVVVSHHLTSYALVMFLVIWTTLFFLVRKIKFLRQSHELKAHAPAGPGGIALPGTVLCFIWLTYTGDLAVGYLTPHIDSISHQLTQILMRENAPRQLFHNASGFIVPLWNRVLSYASVALILIGLPPGLYYIWKHHRSNAVVLLLAGVALAYPVTQALRLIPAGGETGSRATEFVFLGIALVLAVGAAHLWFSHSIRFGGRAAIMCATGIICVGQLVLGSGQPWTMLPGPYLVSADARSIEPEGISAATWANSHLEPGNRIVGDRINTLLMATYGDEQAETSGSSNLPVSQVFTALRFGNGVVAILLRDKIQYLVVDHRLSTSLPYVGTYFNQPASGELPVTSPISMVALTKFDTVPNVSRIFDSGDIVIYDVRAVTPASSVPSTLEPSCMSTPTTVAPSYPQVAKHYAGTFFDVSTDLKVSIKLTGVQQQKGRLCGYLNSASVKGLFRGFITHNAHIQFFLTNGTGQTAISFDGEMLSDGTIVGTYCSSGIDTGNCSDYGLWSVSPIS